MVFIREARLEELRIIWQLEQELFGQHSYPLFVLRQLFDITNGLFLVAEVAGTIAGYAIGHYEPEKAEGWLLSLGVQPACRGRGLGESLTAALTAAIQAKGARTVLLTVHPDNVPALKIYREAGFAIAQQHPDYYFDGSPRLLMAKTI